MLTSRTGVLKLTGYIYIVKAVPTLQTSGKRHDPTFGQYPQELHTDSIALLS